MKERKYLVSEHEFTRLTQLSELASSSSNQHEADNARQKMRGFIDQVKAREVVTAEADPKPSRAEDLLPADFARKHRFRRWLEKHRLKMDDDGNCRPSDVCLGCSEKFENGDDYVCPIRGPLYKSDIHGATHERCAMAFFDRWRELKDEEEPGSWRPPEPFASFDDDDIPF